MTYTRKLLGLGAASLLVMAAVLTTVPAASADDEPQTLGNISRTFLYQGSVQWKDFDDDKKDPGEDPWTTEGAGWYDPKDRDNLCLIRMFGTPIGSGIYYDTLRITTNEVPNILVAEIEKTMIRVGCPIGFLFVSEPDDGWIGHSGANVFVSPGVTQSHLLCFATFEKICQPDPPTAEWFLYVCKNNPQEMEFVPGNLLPPFLGDSGSRAVSQPKEPKDPTDPESPAGCSEKNSYDASGHLDPQTQGQSSVDPVHLDELWKGKEKTGDSAYVVSCYRMQFDAFPPKAKEPNPRTAESHDWFLVLKTGDLAKWPGHLEHHLLGTNLLGTKGQTGHLLQGLYTLNGDNDCPWDMDEGTDFTLDPDNKKEKKDPVVPAPIPGLGNVDLGIAE